MSEPNEKWGSAERDMLVRIDTRMDAFEKRFDAHTQEVKAQFAELKAVMVTMPRFRPVELVTYGLVALMLAGVVGAVLSLVLRNAP